MMVDFSEIFTFLIIVKIKKIKNKNFKSDTSKIYSQLYIFLFMI